jgi:hypothetical protein
MLLAWLVGPVDEAVEVLRDENVDEGGLSWGKNGQLLNHTLSVGRKPIENSPL